MQEPAVLPGLSLIFTVITLPAVLKICLLSQPAEHFWAIVVRLIEITINIIMAVPRNAVILDLLASKPKVRPAVPVAPQAIVTIKTGSSPIAVLPQV